MRAIPDAICWSEGMHLLPQHFQLQSLRAESLSARLTESAHPWYWGIQNFQINPLLLSSGTVVVTLLEAIMPDGMVVNFDPAKDERHTLGLVLDAKDFDENHPLTIYLAVNTLWRADQLQNLRGRLRSSISAPVADLSSGKFAQPLQIWRPLLRLVTDSQSAVSECIPLLRVIHEDGRFIQQSYLPPCSILPPDSPVSLRISDVCFAARKKCDSLASHFRHAEEDGKVLESAELRSQLRGIWARLPELQATLETGIAHPLALYLQLVGFTGALAGLQPEAGVPGFKPLKFTELQQGFDEVLTWIETRLNSIRASYTQRLFKHADNDFSIALLETNTHEQHLVIGLRMPSGSPLQAARERLEQAIIASRPQLQALSRQRRHGLFFHSLGRNDQVAYGVGENVQLFNIHARGEWFVPDAELCLFMPPNSGRVEPLEIMMFETSKRD